MKAALQSYLRTAAVAMAAVCIALEGNVFNAEGANALFYAAMVAIAGPAARALNPRDDAFGFSENDLREDS